MKNGEVSMNVGPQPLDRILRERGLKNHDLVAAVEPGFITHKQVQKARKGRRLTLRTQEKVLRALNACVAPDSYAFEEIFTYRGKKPLRPAPDEK